MKIMIFYDKSNDKSDPGEYLYSIRVKRMVFFYCILPVPDIYYLMNKRTG